MVTTVSVSTITTITTIAAMGVLSGVITSGMVFLVSLLSTRELFVANGNQTSARIGRYVVMAIIPLLISFFVIMSIQIIRIIS